MEFVLSFVETVIVAAFISAVAYGGIILGKNLRMRKNAKVAQESQESTVVDKAE